MSFGLKTCHKNVLLCRSFNNCSVLARAGAWGGLAWLSREVCDGDGVERRWGTIRLVE